MPALSRPSTHFGPGCPGLLQLGLGMSKDKCHHLSGFSTPSSSQDETLFFFFFPLLLQETCLV